MFIHDEERLPLLLGDNEKIVLASGYESIVDHCKKSVIIPFEYPSLAQTLSAHRYRSKMSGRNR